MKMKCTTLPPESGSGCQSAKHRWRTNFQKIEKIPLRYSALLSCEHSPVVFLDPTNSQVIMISTKKVKADKEPQGHEVRKEEIALKLQMKLLVK